MPKRNTFLTGPDDPAARAVWRVSQVYWVVVLYSGIWILLRSYGIGGPPLPSWSVATVVSAFVLAIINLTLRSRSAIRRGGYGDNDRDPIGWVYTTLDLIVVTVAIRATGGHASSLWPVFFVAVVGESVLSHPKEGRLIRIGASVALLMATVPIPFRADPYLLEITTRLLFLIAVSMVAQRLRLNSDHQKAEVASLRAELAMSEEKTKLSREIHDGVGNALAASVLRLEVSARTLEKGKEEPANAPILLREEASMLREAMNSVRDWTFFNKPWSSETGSSQPSLRMLAEVERLSRRINLPLRVEGAEILDSLPAGTRLVVIRITQEALTNAAKYAKEATGATIRLEREGRWVKLTITDDGVGFDPATVGSGVGMSSMRERAEGIGGTLTIDSAPGKGVTLAARLPAT